MLKLHSSSQNIMIKNIILALKIEEWKRLNSDDCHFFRPYVSETDLVEARSGETSCGINLTQTLLWVHQQQWQRELLTRYGNHISLIDAIYCTMKYELLLFFVCVCTHQFGIQGCSTVHCTIRKCGVHCRSIECPKRVDCNWNPPVAFQMQSFLHWSRHFLVQLSMVVTFTGNRHGPGGEQDRKNGLDRNDADCLLDLFHACA